MRQDENKAGLQQSDADMAEVELTDDDILDAMQHIPGYLDITAEDFRAIYRLAHHHALDRVFASLTAQRLMKPVQTPLAPDMTMDVAAATLAKSGFKSLPVVNADGVVVGMLTETDFLRRLKAGSFLELLLRMMDDTYEFSHRCHETTVREAMTLSVVAVGPGAGFREIVKSFSRHAGRSMPVVGEDGKLQGLLLRKDFIHQMNLGLKWHFENTW
jgi:CBS domain-containing membrane protein